MQIGQDRPGWAQIDADRHKYNQRGIWPKKGAAGPRWAYIGPGRPEGRVFSVAIGRRWGRFASISRLGSFQIGRNAWARLALIPDCKKFVVRLNARLP